MKRIYSLLLILLAGLLAACQKDNITSLPAGSVSIADFAEKDTLTEELTTLKDTIVVVGLKATLNGAAASRDHYVTFRRDTTLLTSYRTKYGAATLLPYNAYLFVRPACSIPAGATTSDSIQLNLVSQTSLKPGTVYVLPIVIDHVDGNADATTPGEVLYIVVKTAKRPDISKSGWRIASVSSVNGVSYGENVLDNDASTTWISGFGPMPQNLVIDFGEQIDFSGVSYSTPENYYAIGGYPTKVKLEVSLNGTTWTDKGTYDGVTTPVTWKQDIGPTTARYLRFTVLAAAPYSSLSLVIIGDISLVP